MLEMLKGRAISLLFVQYAYAFRNGVAEEETNMPTSLAREKLSRLLTRALSSAAAANVTNANAIYLT